MRIAVAGDLHCNVESAGKYQPMLAQLSGIDVLALCGDLTDYGLPDEAHLLARELSATIKVPIVAVLGNHDFESGRENEVRSIFESAGVHMLDGDAIEIGGVGFAGVKGFAGGFGRRSLQPWGETDIKEFVQAGVREAVKLESALAKLRTPTRIALLHYSPIAETVFGEPEPIYPFLGTSRLEDPLERYEVKAAFHGHAHHGTIEGKTRSGIPVFNVAMPLLKRRAPDASPFFVYELEPAAARAD